jgi:hypothetical protein
MVSVIGSIGFISLIGTPARGGRAPSAYGAPDKNIQCFPLL